MAKKIMFNDKYGLTTAVLEGRKTMTRRIATTLYPHYHPGEIVAVAQSYEQIYLGFSEPCMRHDFCMRVSSLHHTGNLHNIAGWTNKMFVKANLMPHRIRITYVKMERLQDINEEDIYREGFEKTSVNNGWGNAAWHWETMLTYMDDLGRYKDIRSRNPQDAYACLIDHVSGYGTWEKNPCVFVYQFELLKTNILTQN